MEIMTVRAPDKLQKLLKEKASEQGQTRNALVLQILWNWAEQEEHQRKEGGRHETRRSDQLRR